MDFILNVLKLQTCQAVVLHVIRATSEPITHLSLSQNLSTVQIIILPFFSHHPQHTESSSGGLKKNIEYRRVTITIGFATNQHL